MQEQSKRKSGISSYVGFNLEQQENAAKHFQSKFAQFGNQRMEKLEREKTEEEVKIIEDIISKMPEFIAQWEGNPITGMTPRHIYIIKEGKLKEEIRKSMQGMRSVYLPREECVLFFHSVNSLDYAISIAHELIHFNSFQSVQPKKSANREIKKRRVGFEIHSKTDQVLFFGINEAITVELGKRFDRQYFKWMDLLREEVRERNHFKKEMESEGEDIAYLIKNQDENGKNFKDYSYKKYRARLTEIIDVIYEKNPEEFNSKEEIFVLFAQAALNGKLLKIARLIEKACGKGSFRKLGEETKKQPTHA